MTKTNETRQATNSNGSSGGTLSYDEQLKHNFMQLIQSLELEDRQKLFLENRWMDQVVWMEKRANVCRDRHTRFKLTAILLSVITPILVGANTFLPPNKQWEPWLKGGTLFISTVVAIAGSIDEFFNYGKRWYSYRQSVESLKSEGWQFFELTGSYLNKTHAEAFPDFTHQVEDTIRRDVNLFTAQQQQSAKGDTLQSEVADGSTNAHTSSPAKQKLSPE